MWRPPVCSDQITVRQSQVDKLYAGLKDLALERRQKLEEALRLFGLNREVDDLMQWIAEREVGDTSLRTLAFATGHLSKGHTYSSLACFLSVCPTE